MKNQKHGLTSNEADILLDHFKPYLGHHQCYLMNMEPHSSINFHAACMQYKSSEGDQYNSNVREWLNNT